MNCLFLEFFHLIFFEPWVTETTDKSGLLVHDLGQNPVYLNVGKKLSGLYLFIYLLTINISSHVACESSFCFFVFAFFTLHLLRV